MKLEEYILAFCDTTKGFNGHKPIVVDGKTLASDGRILIRIDREVEEYRDHKWKVEPDIERCLAWDCNSSLVVIPPVEKPSGYNSHWRPAVCECCHKQLLGNEDLDPEAAKVGVDVVGTEGIKFAARYLWLIRQLPDVETQYGDDMLRFRFAGGLGALMGLNEVKCDRRTK